MENPILILPGFSLKNKDWAVQISDQISDELQPHFEAKIWQWKHWGTGDNADFSDEFEAQSIITQLKNQHDKPMHVLAKSIGTYVLAKAVKHSPELFAKIILCGVPLNDLEKNEWSDYINFKNVASPMICFQNDQDSHGNFAQVSKFFEEKNVHIPVVKKLADNHDYCYSSAFISFLSA